MVLVNFTVVKTRLLIKDKVKESSMMTEDDTFSYIRSFPQVFPVFRVRSQSDTSGFKSRILTRLRAACSGMLLFVLSVYLFVGCFINEDFWHYICLNASGFACKLPF